MFFLALIESRLGCEMEYMDDPIRCLEVISLSDETITGNDYTSMLRSLGRRTVENCGSAGSGMFVSYLMKVP